MDKQLRYTMVRDEVSEADVYEIAAGHEVAALVIVRDDGTCTVAWGRGWGVFDRMPGVWANEQEAKKTVQRVIGHVDWYQTEQRIWEGRLSIT